MRHATQTGETRVACEKISVTLTFLTSVRLVPRLQSPWLWCMGYGSLRDQQNSVQLKDKPKARIKPVFKNIKQVDRRKSCRILLYFDLRPGPKILFQGNTPEGSDTFQRPVIERDRVGGLRLMIWNKVKVPFCHYSHAPEESNLWTAWQLFPLDDD